VLAEIAGYVGAAFVIGAASLFLGQNWEVLGRGGRFGVLAAITVALLVSGVAVLWRDLARSGPGWWRDEPADDVRRRLASTLLTGAAAAGSFAVVVGLSPDGRPPAGYVPVAGSATALVIVAAGYLLARGAVGQLGVAISAYAVVASGLSLAPVGGGWWYGGAAVVLGAAWAVLVWRRWVPERRFGLAITATFALAGAQTVALSGDPARYPGYALTALAAAACFAGYARLRDWVLLAGGVVGATLVVPEFLYEVTGGSLGASGVLLVAGVTLLGGSLAGLRIRADHQVSPPPA
jgi:hypothetical protein